MATQNNMTKQPSQPQAAASRAASAQAHDMDALDKLAARKAAQPQADKAADVANADAQAVAENAAPAQMASAEGAVAADAAAAGGVAAEAGAGTAAAGLSPLAIGGGVLGLAVVAAAAGGGSSGGSNGPASAPLAVKPPVSNVPADTQQPAAPSAEKPPVAEAPATSPAADAPAAQAPAAETPATPPAAQPAPQKPVQTVTTGPAVAQGEPGAPKVAETGETKLSNLKTVFENSAGEKTPVKFVQITHIQASESEHPNARSVRYGDEGPKQTPSADHDADAHGFRAASPFVLRALPAEGQQQAPGGAAQGGKTVLTAYEVIESKTPMTLAEAKAHAEKLGGKLLTIDDQKELDWLNENLRGLGHQGENNDNSKAAWIGSNKLHEGNAMITTGTDDTGHKPETIAQGAEAKLSRFVIEYDNYQAPLTLDGKPVQEGQIIKAEDFDKLVWNSTYSQSGAIRFQPVDSDDPKAAKPLPNTQPHNISITESPEVKQPTAPAQPAPAQTDANTQQGGQPTQGSDKPPVKDTYEGDAEHKGDTEHKADPQPAEHLPQYQAQPPVKVAHDATAKLDPAIFKGSDSEHPAGAVKILEVKPGTLKLDGQNVEANQVITADQFEKLSWDASTSKGGEFRFIAVRPEEGHAHYDAAKVQAQTITIDEAAAAPRYEGDAQTVDVRQNIKQTLGEALFKGTAADDAPAFIRIGKVNETADSNSAESALFVNKGRDAYTPLKEGSEVSFEDFKHIAWDSAQNNGGSFTFQALDHHKQPIAGSPLQTVTVHETPNLPNYGSDAKEVSVAHNANHHLDAALFKGADGVTPAGVRILYVHGENGYEGPVLKVGNDGAARSVSADDVITMAEFDRVYLDASQFNGKASFKFVPVDEQGHNVQGPDAANPVSREVKITEAAPQESSVQSPQSPAPQAGNPSQAGNASQPSGPSAGTGEASRTEGEHSDAPQQGGSTSGQNQPSGPQNQAQGQTQDPVQGQAHSPSDEHAPTPPAAPEGSKQTDPAVQEGNSQSQGASSTQEGSPKTQETSGTQEEGGKQTQTVSTSPANGEQPPQSPAPQQQEGKVSQPPAPEGTESQQPKESQSEASGETSASGPKALPLQFKDLLGHEELFGEASPTADNGHISYAPSSSLVSNLIDPLHEVPMV